MLDKNIPVLLKGGYNEGYSSNQGYTVLDGALKIRKGRMTVERVKVR